MPLPPHYQSIFPEWRDAAPYVMDDMVSLQPALAEDILGMHEPAGVVAGAIGAALAADEPIVVVGCGTSEHGSQVIADLLDEAIRARVRALHQHDDPPKTTYQIYAREIANPVPPAPQRK